jgi:hypothetical protein
MEKITVDLVAKTDKAVKQVEELKQQVAELSKTVEKSNETTEKGLKGVKGVASNVGKGVKQVGGAIKKLGRGLGVFALIIAAAGELKKVFQENQTVMDLYNTAFEVVSIAFNDFVSFIIGNFGTVKEFFNALFTDPLVTMKEFVNVFKKGVIDRFNQFKETLGFIGKGLGQLFKGDFSDAMESFKQAGKESVDIITGQDQSFEAVKKTVVGYTKAVVTQAKETIKANKAAELAKVANAGLIEQYDILAEQQRQVRDEERNTIEQRITANNKLRDTLEEQGRVMKENAQLVLNAAQLAYDKNQTDENAIALQEAKNELLAVEATVTGFLSEQKTNDLALEKEKQDLAQSNIDANAERQKAERDFQAEQIEGDFLRITKQIENAEIERQIEQKRLEDKKALYTEGTQAFADADNELKAYKKEADRIDIENEKKLQVSKQQLVTDALGNLATIVGKNSKFGKAIAVVQAIRDTYAAANTALKSAPPPFNFIAAAATVAAGIANVKAITATKDPKPPAFAKGGGGGGSVPTPSAIAPPAFNVVGSNPTNQLADVISEQTQQPVKAFVVSNDVTTAQELDRNIVQGAALG